MIKYINIILGFYLLALAIAPCADSANWGGYDMDKSLGLELSETTDHDHDHDKKDFCSPLCSCSCCQITIRPTMKQNWQISISPRIVTKSPLRESDVHDFACLDDIWQPPKFS